ncbi:MAG: hypothetical protein ACLPN6_25120 [Streptosporangiaceae bacterium]
MSACAMGRIGAFPRLLAIVSARHRSPAVSVLEAEAQPAGAGA